MSTPAPQRPVAPIPPFTPVPRAAKRHNGWKPEVQRAFIEALAETGSVRAACRRVGRADHGAYKLRHHPAGDSFREAWDAALKLGIRRIEDIAMDRAINGVEQPVYSYGKLIGTRTSYNDRLLMFLLRNRAPERFCDGTAKALTGIDRTRLEREKRKWRKEWELEQEEKRSTVSPAQLHASINRKVEQVRLMYEADKAREWEKLSEETRAAWEHFEALRLRDVEALQLDKVPKAPEREPVRGLLSDNFAGPELGEGCADGTDEPPALDAKDDCPDHWKK